MQKPLLDNLDPLDIAAYQSRPELRSEACHDLAQRSIPGVFAYFVAWAIIYFTSGLDQPNDTLLEFLGFMLAAAGVGRLYLALQFKTVYAASPSRWRWLFVFGTTM